MGERFLHKTCLITSLPESGNTLVSHIWRRGSGPSVPFCFLRNPIVVLLTTMTSSNVEGWCRSHSLGGPELKLRPRSNAELGAIDEIDPSGNDPFHAFKLFAADRWTSSHQMVGAKIRHNFFHLILHAPFSCMAEVIMCRRVTMGDVCYETSAVLGILSDARSRKLECRMANCIV
jgi:hypothetical protein